MALLDTIGTHINLNQVDNHAQANMLFPTNTTDDVVVNEDGDTLTEYVVTVESGDKKNPMSAKEITTDTISTEALNVILGVVLDE